MSSLRRTLSLPGSSVPWSSISLPLSGISLSRSSSSVPRSSISLSRGSISLPQGSISLPRGSISLPRSSISLSRGSISLPRGSISLPWGSISLSRSGSSLPRSGISFPRSGISLPRSGSSLPLSGSSLPRSGISFPQSSISLPRSSSFSAGATDLALQSRSTDVHQNLALEDWIDANVDLQRRRVLLLWRNRPSVVIGRHQNPWAECDLRAMRRAGVPLARRRSGGGTVFHDLGNLNLSFFSSRQAYDRQRNLKVVTDGLRRVRPELNLHATERLDILLNGQLKISGSASRLSRKSCFHHLTLLHSADRTTLSAVLRPSCTGIHSNATPSVRSPVANLRDHAPSLQWEELLQALLLQYNAEFGCSAALTAVDPDDESAFPGVGQAAAELRGWDWTFGKTPKFSVRTPLQLSDRRGGCSTAQLQLEVKAGVMEVVELHVPEDWIPERLSAELSVVLQGQRFCPQSAAATFSVLLRAESGEMRAESSEMRAESGMMRAESGMMRAESGELLRDRLNNLCDAVLSAMG